MAAFNWSHARPGRAETQLELCQPASHRPGTEPGRPGRGEATDYKPFSVLCQLELLPPSLPQPGVKQGQTTCLFLHWKLRSDENDLFSNKDGETLGFLLVEQSSKYYGNNYTSCHPTAWLCNIVVMRRLGLGLGHDLRRKYKLVIDYQLQTTQLIMRASPLKILQQALYLRSDTNQDVYYRFISVS